jgi:hypothetical protein
VRHFFLSFFSVKPALGLLVGCNMKTSADGEVQLEWMLRA